MYINYENGDVKFPLYTKCMQNMLGFNFNLILQGILFFKQILVGRKNFIRFKTQISPTKLDT